jgi:hypothetical protein
MACHSVREKIRSLLKPQKGQLAAKKGLDTLLTTQKPDSSAGCGDVCSMKQQYRSRPKDTVGKTSIQLSNRADLFLLIELEVRNDKIFARMSSPRDSVSFETVQLPISIEDLNESFEIIVSAAKVSSEMPKSTFRSIAEYGYDLFLRMFDGNEEVREDLSRWIENESIPQRSSGTGDFISGYLSPPRILIVAEGINVPWELLYARNPSEFTEDGRPIEIDTKYFLGFNFVFQKHLRLERSRASYLSSMSPGQGITFFLGDNLKFAEPIEKSGIELEFLSDGRRFRFEDPFLPSSSGQGRDLVAQRINALSDPILHFACHAKIENGRATLRIRDGYFQEQLPLFQSLNPRRDGSTFVFLNACELSVRRSNDYCGIINGLIEKGVSLIISTLIPVSDRIAALFSLHVYKYFISSGNRSLLNAVFLARHRILEDENSLVGLTYSTYGSWDLVRS